MSGAATDIAMRKGARASFFSGMRGALSAPTMILIASMVGFGGLARELGFDLWLTMTMTALIWALPSQVVLVGSIASGAGLIASALAVTLSAVRLLPMTVAWIPLVRARNGKQIWLYLLSHYVAVTAWVESMRRLPAMAREDRLPYFAGFALVLSSLNIVATGVGHQIAGELPGILSAGLFLLTPTYFLLSLSGAAQLLSDKLAMVAGLLLGPFFFWLAPGFDLLWTGLVGGTLAYVVRTVLLKRGKHADA